MSPTALRRVQRSRVPALLACVGLVLGGCKGMNTVETVAVAVAATVAVAGITYAVVKYQQKRDAERAEIERAKANAKPDVLTAAKQQAPEAKGVAVPVDESKTKYVIVDASTGEPVQNKQGKVETYTINDPAVTSPKKDDQGNPVASTGTIDGYKVVFPTL